MVALEAALKWLLDRWQIALVIAAVVIVHLYGQSKYSDGYEKAAAEGAASYSKLQVQHAEAALKAAHQTQSDLLRQVTRAQAAEESLFQQFGMHADDAKQLQERIPHVTTQYKASVAAVPQPIPHCVFTAGWLRDYNAALGVPAASATAVASAFAKATSAATGTDAELLESGVTPADILAHAQDYGRWARDNLAQLNSLLDLQKE
ncbi:lysis protein [Pseudomonas lactis]|uniref:lysis protein n=1 Tax=Pseudomonas lactis TaxID=1615674 RepID=UPI00190BD2BF|nr:lysis protein [Pseudomonas lactis]MBK3440782.1 lysis protein [Pseudomonas lactis]